MGGAVLLPQGWEGLGDGACFQDSFDTLGYVDRVAKESTACPLRWEVSLLDVATHSCKINAQC